MITYCSVLDSSNIAVFSGINGAGKTTIISHVVDAFYEFAKIGFRIEFKDVSDKFYMISSGLTMLDKQKPSLCIFVLKTMAT